MRRPERISPPAGRRVSQHSAPRAGAPTISSNCNDNYIPGLSLSSTLQVPASHIYYQYWPNHSHAKRPLTQLRHKPWVPSSQNFSPTKVQEEGDVNAPRPSPEKCRSFISTARRKSILVRKDSDTPAADGDKTPDSPKVSRRGMALISDNDPFADDMMSLVMRSEVMPGMALEPLTWRAAFCRKAARRKSNRSLPTLQVHFGLCMPTVQDPSVAGILKHKARNGKVPPIGLLGGCTIVCTL
ncbi:uncharacterized protein K452DRAFT_301636 [Aplosporella prunicola CBS 121167]|uniref:Uncharacterized protein n=1 Tax=Aplosporella prunicola CBS 121167 TaxID=1176127 RepID=A0A6A6B179_9PEZI|nr:uncharacterized protein K452DRAFT_301636 [Aplosporella prunicola CBS 121167]KAF2137919.1 hypothetical protein K452DRAFT_301636 [Aplosporella prunicola CBS 121167]